jgi:hypothetical protein
VRDRPLCGVEGAVVRTVTDLPDLLEGAVRVGPYSVARPDAVLRIVPGLARFLARDGNAIEVAPEQGADWGDIESLLEGPLAAALIHQRGELPLHGAALIPPDANLALVIVGPRGAGKSTVAYELVRRGWRLVSDDLTRITWTDGRVLVWPGRAGIKLCRDACERFGLEAAGMVKVAGDRDKVLAPVAAEKGTFQLDAIAAIDREATNGCSRVTGAAGMALISEHTFRAGYIAALGQAPAHLRMVSAILPRIPLFRLSGPYSPGQFAERLSRIVRGQASTGHS